MPSTRERLLYTALDLFSTHGYQSTSLRDLATQLGVQPGSIYNHIENKQSLLFELMEEAMDDLLDQTRLGLKR
jgi:AcrR family transcriptional regulator